jgi:hypothetical protein
MTDSNRKKRDEEDDSGGSASSVSRYNPEDRRDNCGWASLSRAGEELTKILVTGEELFMAGMHELSIPPKPEGGYKDDKRVLSLSVVHEDEIPASLYQPTIDRAEKSVLIKSFTLEGMARVLGFSVNVLKYATKLNSGPSSLDLFLQIVREPRVEVSKRFNQLARSRAVQTGGKVEGIEQHLRSALCGQHILGIRRGDSHHFVNLDINEMGNVSGFDAQDGRSYDPRALNQPLEVKAQVHVVKADKKKLEQFQGLARKPQQPGGYRDKPA